MNNESVHRKEQLASRVNKKPEKMLTLLTFTFATHSMQYCAPGGFVSDSHRRLAAARQGMVSYVKN